MQEEAIKMLHNRLKENGYSVTAPRRLVFDLLNGKEPQTMQDLERASHGRMDRASLYRTVTLYINIGIARKIAVGWKYKVELSDLFTHHHHHMTCLGCHTIIPIDEAELEEFIDLLARKHSFQISEHQVELQGLCSTCKERR